MYRALALVIVLLSLGAGASAETLLIEAIEQQPPNSPQGLLRPRGGETMSQVEDRFGKPLAIKGPVGDPPITRWDYPNFSVFFEHDRAIHSVVKR
ncbi:hypothetical protein [endosymbiont of unidentified scaly snail isolate Monju]|uniref:hypothetical protein n=1 Tax=endosymbiont of unidentified scaly snail isolate Monju TaxID=1248727 RepID=UPI000691C00C|nr:hypothetical protein [endosymbiont of unidentified scaly snail isolate Monju]